MKTFVWMCVDRGNQGHAWTFPTKSHAESARDYAATHKECSPITAPRRLPISGVMLRYEPVHLSIGASRYDCGLYWTLRQDADAAMRTGEE